MPDLSALSPQALSAAMRGGVVGWGQVGSARVHLLYIERAPNRRRKCQCGCGGRATHLAFANGVALSQGCEMHVRRFVRAANAAKELAE
jgi:hypothetical protein